MVEKNRYIERFKTLYEETTGSAISDDAALEYFEKLIALVDAIYKPKTHDFYGQ